MTKTKHTYEEVKSYVESFEGYILLSKEYKNAITKLQMQCPEGHIFWKTYNNFQQGHRCHECTGSKRFTITQVRKEIEKEGYELLTDSYKNAHEYLEIKCDKGHIYNAPFLVWRRGGRCLKCNGTPKLEYNFIKEEVEKKGYVLLSEEYENCKSKLSLKCPNNHKCKISWSNFRKGRGCPICVLSSNSSKPEKEIKEFVKSISNTDVIGNSKGIIKNPKTKMSFELDIWLPELNKAVEFNGVYWHSKDVVKKRDEIKKEQCINKGIELLVVKEEDYVNDRDQTLDNIRNFIENIKKI